MKSDNLTDSEYELSSNYETTEEEDVIIRNSKNNLSNLNLIDYSALKCASCNSTKKEDNNIGISLLILLSFLIILLYLFINKR